MAERDGFLFVRFLQHLPLSLLIALRLRLLYFLHPFADVSISERRVVFDHFTAAPKQLMASTTIGCCVPSPAYEGLRIP